MTEVFELGRKYMLGDGMPLDTAKGISLFFTGASGGCSACMWALGVVFERGMGVPKHLRKARRWYTKSAKHGFSEASFSLGSLLHRLGKHKKALHWFMLAAADNHDLGLLSLGIYRHRGIGCNIDTKAAEELYGKAIDKGSLEATLHLAALRAERGDKSSVEKAEQVATEACNALTPRMWLARRSLLRLLESPYKLTRDSLAVAMQDADNGDIDACTWCGEVLLLEYTNFMNPQAAITYLDIAIANSRTVAMITKAIMLSDGHWVSVNLCGARKLLQEAASLGDLDATSILEHLASPEKSMREE